VENFHVLAKQTGDYSAPFGGMLRLAKSGSAFVDTTRIPDGSYAFWRPNVPLFHVDFQGKKRYTMLFPASLTPIVVTPVGLRDLPRSPLIKTGQNGCSGKRLTALMCPPSPLVERGLGGEAG
jgi:hypothetical protein